MSSWPTHWAIEEPLVEAATLHALPLAAAFLLVLSRLILGRTGRGAGWLQHSEHLWFRVITWLWAFQANLVIWRAWDTSHGLSSLSLLAYMSVLMIGSFTVLGILFAVEGCLASIARGRQLTARPLTLASDGGGSLDRALGREIGLRGLVILQVVLHWSWIAVTSWVFLAPDRP